MDTMQTQRPSIAESFELIRSKISSPEFLEGRGLGNEVPFHIFAYDARLEDEVRARTLKLIGESERGDIPTRIVHMDLWDIFLSICEKRRILEKIPDLEGRRGTDALLARMHRIATPELFVSTMSERCRERAGELQPGKDMLLITGVGKVYPLMRAHSILENAQAEFAGIPVLMLYPGSYDGQSLKLFGSIGDGHYYRAFNLI